MTGTDNPTKALTTRARDYIRIAATQPTLNYAAIAAMAGVTRQSVQRILSKSDVQHYLRQELDRQADNARDSITKVGRSASRIASIMLEELERPDVDLAVVAGLSDKLPTLLNLLERLQATANQGSQAPRWQQALDDARADMVRRVLAKPGLWRRWMMRRQAQAQPPGVGPSGG